MIATCNLHTFDFDLNLDHDSAIIVGGVRCLLHIVKLTFISSGCSYLMESHDMIEITMQELLPVPILNIYPMPV